MKKYFFLDPMLGEEDDGYSLEGFDVSNITIEVASSQIVLKEEI